MHEIHAWLSFSSVVCRAFALFSLVVNYRFASSSMILWIGGRIECPCSRKGCRHLSDTTHSKGAEYREQRNSISNLLPGTRRHISKRARERTTRYVPAKFRLVQMFVDGARLVQSSQDQLFFRTGIPVRILRGDFGGPVDPRLEIFGVVPGIGTFARNCDVNGACRRVGVVVHHRVLRFLAPGLEDAPAAF